MPFGQQLLLETVDSWARDTVQQRMFLTIDTLPPPALPPHPSYSKVAKYRALLSANVSITAFIVSTPTQETLYTQLYTVIKKSSSANPWL